MQFFHRKGATIKKYSILPFLFAILFLGIPFESKIFPIFKPFSRSLLHKFQEIVPFSFEIPPFFEKNIHFYFSEVVIFIIICHLLSSKVTTRSFLFNTNSKYLTLLFLVATLSLITSSFSRYYIQYFHLAHFALLLLAFDTVAYFFQNRGRDIHILFWTLLPIIAIECAIGIFQFFWQESVGLSFLGELHLTLDEPNLATFHLSEKSRQLLSWFTQIPPDQHLLFRSSGTFSHPNVFAGFLTASLMISYYCFSSAKKKWGKGIISILILMEVLTLFLTFSRAGMIAWILGTTTWFGIILFKRAEDNHGNKSLLSLSLVIFGALLPTLALLFNQLLDRGGVFNYNTLVRASDAGRMAYQKAAIEMIKENPLLGVGYNCYSLSPAANSKTGWVHNIYLLIGAEMGLIGLVLFGLFLFSLIYPFIRNKIDLFSTTLLSIFIGFLFIGLCDFYFLIVPSGKLLFFLFTGLLSARGLSLQPMINRSCNKFFKRNPTISN